MRDSRRLLGTVLLAVTACVGPGRPQPQPPPVPEAAVVPDASYDWHILVTVPFGTLLKESPTPLHEVLLFHEAAPADAENKDCYAIDGAAPHFVGQQPDQYLLCFDHDHLNRIEAGVRLAAEDAPRVFAKACALWLKNSGPSSSPSPATAPAGTLCEGMDGATSFSARLTLVPGEPIGNLVMTLTHAAPRT
jgi:hypothetical protein